MCVGVSVGVSVHACVRVCVCVCVCGKLTTHRKLTLEKKKKIQPLLPGLESATFQSRVWRSNHRAILAVQVLMTNCKHGQGASVEIVLDVELGVILFHIMYRFREAVNQVESVVEVAVPYQVGTGVALSMGVVCVCVVCCV